MTINDDGLSTFLSMRARLFRIAYRMLGSAAAAEDIVQEVWIRWQSADRCAVRNSTAFLTTMANRLAINMKQAAHFRREIWAAPGLPEPVDPSSDQLIRAERAEALMLGVFVLLGRLSSAERTAYILREAFDFDYRDIANVLEVREDNARQLVSRARLHLAQRPSMSVHPEDHRQLLAVLGAATQTENARVLSDLFAAETQRHQRRRKNQPACRVDHSGGFGQFCGSVTKEASELGFSTHSQVPSSGEVVCFQPQ
jgi:RNA polymerase sigma-70 factor (ECF subfamily)